MNLESLEKDLANEGFCFIEQQTRLRLPRKGSEYNKLNPTYDFYVSRINVYKLLIESLTKELNAVTVKPLAYIFSTEFYVFACDRTFRVYPNGDVTEIFGVRKEDARLIFKNDAVCAYQLEDNWLSRAIISHWSKALKGTI